MVIEHNSGIGPIRFQDLLTDGVLKPLIRHLDFTFPRWCAVKQCIQSHQIDDVIEAVRRELHKEIVRNSVKPGDRIAIGVGSRRIAHMLPIVRSCAEELKSMGALPFIIPAMGSHGRATAEEQAELLAGYGISEENVGVPIEPSMEVAEIGCTSEGVKVMAARAALDDGSQCHGAVQSTRNAWGA